jgi:hypothetical protein
MRDGIIANIVRYYQKAAEYDKKRQLEAPMSLIKNAMATSGKMKKQNDNKYAESKLSKAMNKMMSGEIYGEDWRSSIDSKLWRGLANMWTGLTRIFSLSGLGWNLQSAMPSMFSAATIYATEAALGDYYTKSQYIQAVKGNMFEWLKAFGDIGARRATHSKCLNMMEYFGLTFGDHEMMERQHRNRAWRTLRSATQGFKVWQISSYLPNSVALRAFMSNTKWVEIGGRGRFMTWNEYYNEIVGPDSTRGDVDEALRRSKEEHGKAYWDSLTDNLYDAYRIDKQGRLHRDEKYPMTDAQWNDLEAKIASTMQYIAGYSEGTGQNIDRLGARQNVAVASATTFRFYAIKNMETLMSNPNFNYETHEVTMGFFKSIIQAMRYGTTRGHNVINYFQRKFGKGPTLQGDWQSQDTSMFTQAQKKAYEEAEALYGRLDESEIRRVISRSMRRTSQRALAFMLWWGMYNIMFNLGGDGDGDEDETWLLGQSQYIMRRTVLEQRSFFDIVQMVNLVETVFPIFNYFQMFMQLVVDATSAKGYEEITRGAYKGHMRVTRDIIKLIPFMGAIYKYKDPEARLRNLENVILR